MSVHASRVIDLAEGGLDADLHLAAELPGSATERRRHPEHDLLVGDAASGVLLRSARLRRERGSGAYRDDRRGVGDVRPWRRRGRTRGVAHSFRVRGLLVADAANGIIRGARLRRGRGSGISGYDRRGVGDVRPWRRWGRTHGFARSFRVRGRAIRRLRSSRRRNRLAQALQQTQKLRPQLLAAQFARETSGLLARRAAAQPREAVPVAFARLIRSEFRPWRRPAPDPPPRSQLSGPGLRHARPLQRPTREPRSPASPSDPRAEVAISRSPTRRRSAQPPRSRGCCAVARDGPHHVCRFRPGVRAATSVPANASVPGRGGARTRCLVNSFRVRRRVIRDLRRSRRGICVSGGDFRPSRGRDRTHGLARSARVRGRAIGNLSSGQGGAFPARSICSTSALADCA